MRLRTALLATSMIAAAPVAALAQSVNGPYISVGGAFDYLMRTGIHYSPTGFAGGEFNGPGAVNNGSKADLASDAGGGGQASIGYGIGNGLRAEIEGMYLYDDIYGRKGTAEPGNTSSNHLDSYGPMVNVLYDLDLTGFGIVLPVQPYIGVGAGYLWQHLPGLQTVYTNGDVNRTGGTIGSFAYQGIAGVAYNVPAIPGMALTLDYRFIGTAFDDSSFSSTEYSPNGLNKVNGDANERFHHEAMFGIRYAFNTAPPPPPPAPQPVVGPAPTPARTYLIFFDWDKSFLTPRARQIVAEAAQNSTRVQTTTIEVNGYADTSHALSGERGHDYNLRLSLRRADAVRAELVRDGVPTSVIAVHGYGDSHLLVPTGPNTREPQNRRVEIILH